MLKAFCQYFSLDMISTKEYFDQANSDELDAKEVIEALDINVNGCDSERAGILCKHISTTNDSGVDSFRSNGVYDLKHILTSESELLSAMHKYGLDIGYDEKIIAIDGNNYNLDIPFLECQVCLKGNPDVCGKRYDCEFKGALRSLSRKLYEYDATVEFFISGNLDRIKSYSTISQTPEILYTFDRIKNAVNKNCIEENYLQRYWVENFPLCIVIEFVAPLNDIITFEPISKDASDEWHNYYEDCLVINGFTDFSFPRDNVPKRVYDNIYLIQKFISFYYHGNHEYYGSLLKDIKVKPEQISYIDIL